MGNDYSTPSQQLEARKKPTGSYSRKPNLIPSDKFYTKTSVSVVNFGAPMRGAVVAVLHGHLGFLGRAGLGSRPDSMNISSCWVRIRWLGTLASLIQARMCSLEGMEKRGARVDRRSEVGNYKHTSNTKTDNL